MSLYNEIERLRKEEEALKQQIETLKTKEVVVKNATLPLTNDSREEQAKVASEQCGLLEAKLAETVQLREGYEAALKTMDGTGEHKILNENRGEVNTQQAERDRIAEQFEERKEILDNKAEAIEQISNPLEKLNETHTAVGITERTINNPEHLDMTTAVIAAAGVGAVFLANKAKETTENLKEKFFEKDAGKEWEKDIQKNEQAVNEKYDKELIETEKRYQKQLDYIEKKHDDKSEKEIKTNELKGTIEKVKSDIEKDRTAELQKIEAEKANLEQVKEATSGMKEKERQKEIERQRELERQLELERQRQLEERTR